MTSPYDLLNNVRVDFDTVTEVRKIMEFADEVVDGLYSDLRVAAENPVTLVSPYLLMSYDKATVGDAPGVGESHRAATLTRLIGEVLPLPSPITTTELLRAFMFDEDEIRVALMMVLINLRQIDEEGTSMSRRRAVAASVKTLKVLLGYAASATDAN